MMAKKRWKYLIGVDFKYVDGRRETKYVTSLGPEHNVAHLNDDCYAKEFGLHFAEDIVFGLVCNGFMAYIIKAPIYMDFINPEKEDKDD